MPKDYYKTLGVEKNASQDDIKKAFRKLAHEYHPDKKTGNEAKFKEVNEAYSTLSDPQKRSQYDTFGAAGAAGGFNPGAGAGGFGAGGFGNGQGFDFSQFTRQYGAGQGGQSFEFDLGDLFGEFFGGGAGERNRRPRRGANITVDMQISFKESIFGVERDISISGRAEKLTVKIPSGIENGQGLRVAGKGQPGEPPTGHGQHGGQAGAPGDLIVRIWVEDHPVFRKEGFNLVMNLSIKLTTALGGGTVEIKTLNPEVDGTIELKIPAGTSHGEILRVRGKGVPHETHGIFTGASREKRGDLLVVTHIDMPRKLSKNAAHLIEELKKEGI